MASLIKIENLTFSFAPNAPLLFGNYNLDLPDQKINLLMGPSGCGKSTLLRLINRLVKPNGGQIFYKGEDIASIPVLLLRKKIVLMPYLRFLPNENVRSFVNYAPSLQKTIIDPQLLEEWLKETGLTPDILDKNVRDLSQGELQRINLLRCMVGKPEVLLLDEPTANLDSESTLKIESIILKFAENMNVLWVSHDSEQAKRLNVTPIKLGSL